MRPVLAALLAAAALAACEHREEAPPPRPDPYPGAPAPSASPPGGAYAKVQYVTLAASEPGVVHYTTDGSAPSPGAPGTRSGRNPVFWIRVGPGTTTLTWFAVDDAGNRGPTAVETYEVTLP
jgi:hypothetical protein